MFWPCRYVNLTAGISSWRKPSRVTSLWSKLGNQTKLEMLSSGTQMFLTLILFSDYLAVLEKRKRRFSPTASFQSHVHWCGWCLAHSLKITLNFSPCCFHLTHAHRQYCKATGGREHKPHLCSDYIFITLKKHTVKITSFFF